MNTSGVRLGMDESLLRRSADSFEFAENGHFGDKVQYNSRFPDEFGGSYALHCHNHHVYGIEAKYADSGIDRSNASLILNRLIASIAGAQTEHNLDDLKDKNVQEACEFIYYKNRVRAELTYARNRRDKVREIAVWTD